MDIISDVKKKSDFWSASNVGFLNKGTRLLNAWSPTNPNSDIPALTRSDTNNEQRVSTYFVENGSFLKLRNIQLGYTVPAVISKKMRMDRLRFYCSAQNLLTIKSKKSMLAMSAMNAELQQLQKKYANNRVKLNEEMQKLYEKHGVSPMSGCLPNLIPLPIMMGLYYAVQQPLQYIVGLSRETVIALAQMIGLDQLAGANYTVQILIAEKLNAFVDGSGHFSDAVTNCLQSGETIFPLDFHFFGLNLADTPSISHPSIIWIIPILSGLTAFLSSYIMQKMQGTQNSAAAGQMKMLNFMMPLMSLYFAFILPGAIGIYWIFNNVFTCVQEIILTKTLRGKQEAKQAAEAARIEAEKQAKREAHKAAQKQQSQNAKNKKGDK